MPARKKPVPKRAVSKLNTVILGISIDRLHMPPNTAHITNMRDGEYRSASVRSAKVRVPIINPNCTKDNRYPRMLNPKLNWVARSSITAFPANQREVQKNCEMIMTGSM